VRVKRRRGNSAGNPSGNRGKKKRGYPLPLEGGRGGKKRLRGERRIQSNARIWVKKGSCGEGEVAKRRRKKKT